MFTRVFKLAFKSDFHKIENGKVLASLKLFLIGLFVQVYSAFVQATLSQSGFIQMKGHPALRSIEKSNQLFLAFLSIAVLTPIAEEFAFRYILGGRKFHLTFGIGGLASFCIWILSGWYKHLSFLGILAFDLPFLFLTIGLGLVLHYVSNSSFEVKSKSQLLILLHATSILFALSHFRIIPVSDQIWISSILLSPYYLMGLIYAYARVSLDMRFAILIHSLNNSFFFLIKMFHL